MSSFWEDRIVFVTGASGLVGGWLTRALLGSGAQVVALVRDSAPRSLLVREGDIENVEVVRGDVSDLTLLRRTMCEYSVATVVHLAAQTIVGVAKLDPVGTLETNVRGTWNVLEAARQSGAQVVVASSDKAYGSPESLPYRENHPLRGTSPYDVSKSCADLLCAMYAASFKLPVVVARCGNIFGAGDLNLSRAIPGVILSTIKGERFRIRSDGAFIRDFLYAKDAAAAYMLLAERLSANASLAGEAFNFSLGVRFSVLDVVQLVLELMNRQDLEPIIENIVTGEIREQFLDSSKAEQMLGWAPVYGMRDGLKETIGWYEQFFDSLRRGEKANGQVDSDLYHDLPNQGKCSHPEESPAASPRPQYAFQG
jgi:CDP-glucose 4,6-dehydratase